MYYEINVSLHGKHFFATDKRSVTNKMALKEVYSVFKEKFPHEEGYDILVSYTETIGKYVDMEQFEQENFNMTKQLTEKQLHTRLDKHYKKHYGERDTDEWAVNPSDNVWKFVRNGRTIILECNRETGEVFER